MSKARLEAFSDGVIAILIPIMVLELKAPLGNHWSSLEPVVPYLLTYILSYVFLGIYWNNHHHLLQLTDRVNGTILWANLHLLFWLSLVPFTTSWMGANGFESLPTAAYGVVLLGAALAFLILERAIIAQQGARSRLAAAVGNELKGKISAALYAIAIPAAFFQRAVAGSLYVLIALMWLVPDRRIERAIRAEEQTATKRH